MSMGVTIEIPVEKWSGSVREVTIGATAAEGGTRTSTVTVCGHTALLFLDFEGKVPHPPALAVEIQDCEPTDWSSALIDAWGSDTVKDPVAWAKKAVEVGAKLIYLRLRSADPEIKNTGAEEATATVKAVLGAVGVPLMVIGPGNADKDNEVLVKVAEVTAGERIVLGNCETNNYRTIVAGCLPNDQIAIAWSPIDVNMAKQLNILISDMGLPPERILINPGDCALGYGIEYWYSVAERLRISALQGDSMTQMPFIAAVGEQAWRVKEAKVASGVPAAWGNFKERAVAWEALTAITAIQAGADIVVLRHPESVTQVQKAIDDLFKP